MLSGQKKKPAQVGQHLGRSSLGGNFSFQKTAETCFGFRQKWAAAASAGQRAGIGAHHRAEREKNKNGTDNLEGNHDWLP